MNVSKVLLAALAFAAAICCLSCQKEEDPYKRWQQEVEKQRQQDKDKEEQTTKELSQGREWEAYGYITYSDGTPAAGVSVSDGFKVCVTKEDGSYYLETTSDSYYIYFSYPEDAQITKNTFGNPDFYFKYDKSKPLHNFTLKKQAVENEFVLFAMADPQAHYSARSPQKVADTDRFRTETVPALNEQIKQQNLPCYGVTLGDIVYSEGSRNSVEGMSVMRASMKSVNMPIFQTMGNHDFTYFYKTSQLKTDSESSTLHLRAQRNFEAIFGPINHSFNRGNAHIVCMRDIDYTSDIDASSYQGRFTDEQLEWLKADLANVPKTKMVILCIHIPIVGITNNKNVAEVVNLIKEYPNSTIFSGHTHYKRGVNNVASSGMYEHVHAAVCGQWWWSNLEGDGCPNGYTVYRIGTDGIKDEYFIGVNKEMNTRDYQIRMYRGNMKTGGKNAYFKLPHNANKLLINVFNGDDRWKVEVYENGVLRGNATPVSNSKQTFSSVVTSNTYDINTASSQDWWAIGYHIGVLGRGTNSTSYYTSNFHMYSYNMSSANASIMVKATDAYGNTYTCSDIIEDGTDYPDYVKVAI